MFFSAHSLTRAAAVGAVACILLCADQPATASFVNGDLVVVRIGDGSTSLSSAAQPVYLVEYNATGQQVGAPHLLPSSGSSALTLSAGGQHDGHLTQSSDGRYLLIGGYRADVGATDPTAATAASVNRVIGRVDSNWSPDTSTALTDAYDHTEMSAVASTDGQHFYTAGSGSYTNPVSGNTVYTTSGGLRYTTLGATVTSNLSQTQTTGGSLRPDSLRSARIVGSQLYVNTASAESYGNRGAYRTNNPLPAPDPAQPAGTPAPQSFTGVITNVEGQDPDKTGKYVPKTDVVFLDLSPTVAGLDTAYSTGGKDYYEKWSLVGGVWKKESSLQTAGIGDIQAMDALASGSSVTLYATTPSGVYMLTDGSGYDAASTTKFPLSPFIPATANTEFRGIVVAVPEPSTVSLLGGAAMAALAARRRGRERLRA